MQVVQYSAKCLDLHTCIAWYKMVRIVLLGAVAVMFGVVGFISTLQLGESGNMLPPEIFWNLEAKRLPLRPFLGQCDAHRRPDRSLISQATPFADEACDTIIVRLEERKGIGRGLSRCSQPSRKFQHVTVLAGLV